MDIFLKKKFNMYIFVSKNALLISYIYLGFIICFFKQTKDVHWMTTKKTGSKQFNPMVDSVWQSWNSKEVCLNAEKCQIKSIELCALKMKMNWY